MFDGENLPVLTFIEYCTAAVQAIEPHEEKHFIVFIRTRLTKPALQQMTNVSRGNNELIADYAQRV